MLLDLDNNLNNNNNNNNQKMLLDLNGKYCESTFALLYLYKYILRGNQKVKFNNNTDDLHRKDEINHFIRSRLISTMDIKMWRGFGYRTNNNNNNKYY